MSSPPPPPAAAEGAWQPLPPPPVPLAGLLHVAVWTGKEMLIWGGSGPCGEDELCRHGAAYDDGAGRWRAMNEDGAPAARDLHAAAWTGRELVVWGGRGLGGRVSAAFGDGAAFDPAANRWRPLATAAAPPPRAWHTAVWSGREVLIWGGVDPAGGGAGGGAAYDPAADRWRALPAAGAPRARRYHTAVWSGTEMLVWGGNTPGGDGALADGAAYSPERDRWRALSASGAPAGRWSHTAIWSGSTMVIWGGLGCGTSARGPEFCGDGARYDPAADRWSPIRAGGPSARNGHAAVFTGSEMLIWGGGGRCPDGLCADGAFYDPMRDLWRPLPAPPAGSARAGHTAVWTGERMLVWGGAAPPAESARHDGLIFGRLTR
jgi:hypothetical protein